MQETVLTEDPTTITTVEETVLAGATGTTETKEVTPLLHPTQLDTETGLPGMPTPTQSLKGPLEDESTRGVPSATDGGNPTALELIRDKAPTPDHLLLPVPVADKAMEAEEEVVAAATTAEAEEAVAAAKTRRSNNNRSQP